MHPEELANSVALIVAEYVAKAVEPLKKQIAELDAVLSNLPIAKDGRDGKDGAPGKDAVAEKGIDGRDGRDGKDGRDGQDGKDALEINILPAIDPNKSYVKGTWACHRNGIWMARSQTNDMSGWECMVEGVYKIATQKSGEREYVCLSELSSGAISKALFTDDSAVIFKGIYKAGNKYKKGDQVTWGGSLWYCDEETDEKPGAGKTKWILTAKCGRDGKDGAKGEKGDSGAPGRDGRDLTQMDSTGKKW